MTPFTAALRRLAYLAWHRRVRLSLARADPCSLFGLDLLIEPGILHPRYFLSSRVLARHLMALDLRDKAVADIGTGSGILALLAARSGATVTAVDINPAAIACARGNAKRNGLDGRLSVFESDVFASVPGAARFDLVITNPPFYPRAAASIPDQAFAAGVGNRFFSELAKGAPSRLNKNGSVLLIHSSDADFGPIVRLFEERGMSGQAIKKRLGFFETLTIREFRARA